MNIIKTSRENMTVKEMYDLIQNPNIEKLSMLNETITIGDFILREDVNSKGDDIKVLTVLTDTGEAFATTSPTFIADFESILAMCEQAKAPSPRKITVKHSTSKAGRDFIQCVYEA